MKTSHHVATGALTYLSYCTIWLQLQEKKEWKDQGDQTIAQLKKAFEENENLKGQIAELNS